MTNAYRCRRMSPVSGLFLIEASLSFLAVGLLQEVTFPEQKDDIYLQNKQITYPMWYDSIDWDCRLCIWARWRDGGIGEPSRTNHEGCLLSSLTSEVILSICSRSCTTFLRDEVGNFTLLTNIDNIPLLLSSILQNRTQMLNESLEASDWAWIEWIIVFLV